MGRHALFRKAFVDAGFHLAGVCIWVKNSLVLGRSDYQWQHEPVLYGFLKNGKHPWYSDRKQTTIWNYDKPKRNKNHPTSKPLDLLGYPISNSSQENAIVLDTFGGSGSTLMACEQTDRICHMMELDEKYASAQLPHGTARDLIKWWKMPWTGRSTLSSPKACRGLQGTRWTAFPPYGN